MDRKKYFLIFLRNLFRLSIGLTILVAGLLIVWIINYPEISQRSYNPTKSNMDFAYKAREFDSAIIERYAPYFIKDGKIYFYDIEDKKYLELENADVNSFEIIGDLSVTYNNKAFYKPILFKNKAREAKVIKECEYVCFARDKNFVYKNALQYFQADPSTFELIDHAYYKDRNFVYYENTEIKSADPKTFEVIDWLRAKDKDHYYRAGKIIHFFSFYKGRILQILVIILLIAGLLISSLIAYFSNSGKRFFSNFFDYIGIFIPSTAFLILPFIVRATPNLSNPIYDWSNYLRFTNGTFLYLLLWSLPLYFICFFSKRIFIIVSVPYLVVLSIIIIFLSGLD